MAESRRTFTREYKLSAVKLVTERGRSFSEAARSLGIASELLRRWKAAFEAEGAEAFPDTATSRLPRTNSVASRPRFIASSPNATS